MEKGRLEAFSDAVIAILITVMVLELRVPEHDASLGALRDVYPVFLTYVLSFVYLGIYWNNHHHLLQSSRRVTGGVLWANLHLLFWLSLLPFCTGWMGQNHFERTPTIAYGVVLLLAGIAYYVLQTVLVAAQPDDSLAVALGSDFKGKASPFIYLIGIAAAFLSPWISEVLYVLVAVMWLIPDRRLEPHEEAQG